MPAPSVSNPLIRLTKMFSSLVCFRSVPGLEENPVLGSPRLVASTILLSALLTGVAVRQVHAQNNNSICEQETPPAICHWAETGTVEVSTNTLTIREGESMSYSIWLNQPPLADGWWVRIRVNGVVYYDGRLEEKGVRWVPSVGHRFNQGDSTTPWRTVRITAFQDDDDDRDEFVTITHEVSDENFQCPPSLRGVAPVTVRVTDDETPNNPPTGQPRITGTARVGQTLTAVTTDIQDADGPGDFAYQWKADGTNIAGAMDSSYTLTNNEVGKRITVTVSFTDGIGTEETVTSQPTAAVTDAVTPPPPPPALTVAFDPASYSTTEGGDPVTVRVTLNRTSDQDVTIPITVMPQGATEADDYTVSGLTDDER